MATVIRLTRLGRKNKPFYRIVASDKKFARDGRFIEVLGNYDPHTKKVNLNHDRFKHYQAYGAQVSKVVQRLAEKNQA